MDHATIVDNNNDISRDVAPATNNNNNYYNNNNIGNLDDIKMSLPKTLVGLAVKILETGDIFEKTKLSKIAIELWQSGKLTEIGSSSNPTPPSKPSRPSNLEVVTPGNAPKRGKAGSLANRIALLHSLAHIESWAIDLSWDIIARFPYYNLPKEFYDDWVQVAADETRHFHMLSERLKSVGTYYGAIPVHDGLWESAGQTAGDLLARLVIVHCVHEARGLDITPTNIEKFRVNNDPESAAMLTTIYEEEITHVTAGLKWFNYLCTRDHKPADATNDDYIIDKFHQIVRENFRGILKPPFNTKAREQAGMSERYYLPLASKK